MATNAFATAETDGLRGFRRVEERLLARPIVDADAPAIDDFTTGAACVARCSAAIGQLDLHLRSCVQNSNGRNGLADRSVTDATRKIERPLKR